MWENQFVFFFAPYIVFFIIAMIIFVVEKAEFLQIHGRSTGRGSAVLCLTSGDAVSHIVTKAYSWGVPISVSLYITNIIV